MISAYHGSGVAIEAFDYKFTEAGNDQLGSGFYFTTSLKEAESYCEATLDGKPKPGGMNNPTIHHVKLDFKKLMPSNKKLKFPWIVVEDIIRSSPILEEQIEANWGEIAHDGLNRLVKEAVSAYVYEDEPVSAIKIFNHLSNDFFRGYPREFFELVRKHYGYDGVVCHFDEKKHYVAWFHESIHITKYDHINSPGCFTSKSIKP